MPRRLTDGLVPVGEVLPGLTQASTGLARPEQIKRDVFEAVVSRLDTLPRSVLSDIGL